MNYDEWLKSVPEQIKGDSLWKVEAYRLSLFLVEIGWYDVTKLMGDRRTFAVSDQLYRSLGSIPANISEGYSRGTGRDRARFYEYALGSARESRDWYLSGRYILNEEVIHHRLEVLVHIIKLLLAIIPQQRGRGIRDSSSSYKFVQSTEGEASSLSEFSLLTDIPLA